MLNSCKLRSYIVVAYLNISEFPEWKKYNLRELTIYLDLTFYLVVQRFFFLYVFNFPPKSLK